MNQQLKEAVALDQGGNLAAAMAGYEKVLAREPRNIDALFLLGRAHCQQGKFERGAEILRKAIELSPKHAHAHNLLGMALNRLGRPQEALACFERALATNAQFALALLNKADTLSALGQHAEALVEYDKALALDGTNVVGWCNRGIALEALGRDSAAAESFQRALALNPNLAEIHFNLANVFLRLQRAEDAVRHYQRTLALRPDLATAFANIGRALVLLDRWQEAADSYARALELGENSVQLHHAMGIVFWRFNRFEESLASFDKALALDFNDVDTLNKKGRLLLALGRLDEGRALLERAVAVAPDKIANYLALSNIKQFARPDRELAAMEKLLQGIASRPVEDQIALHFALGKAYRDVGDHERSFRHFRRGNAIKRGQIRYNEAAMLGIFDRVREVFTPELMSSKAGRGDKSAQPIFIVGMPRSGTTLIEQILASHPQVYGAGEREDFKRVLARIIGPANFPHGVPALAPARFDELGSAYLASIGSSAMDAARFTDKGLSNYLYAGTIALALPNARIIHARRDPIDTCLSCFTTLFDDQQEFTYDLGELGRYYRAYERLMEHWRQVLPEDVMLDVQYEQVVEDIEVQARRILSHCGLAWDDACLSFHKLSRPVQTASAAQVRQPLYRTSVGRWHSYREELRPLLEALGQIV